MQGGLTCPSHGPWLVGELILLELNGPTWLHPGMTIQLNLE